jgi:hypothetical protein
MMHGYFIETSGPKIQTSYASALISKAWSLGFGAALEFGFWDLKFSR